MTRKSILLAAAALLALLPLALGAAGTSTREKILGAGKEWQENYAQYKPDPDLLNELKTKIGPDVRIDVYLGLWCPDSRKNVPPFVRIMDELKAPVSVNYYEVPRKSGPDQKYYVEEFRVERVPTFVVYRNDKEAGRIVENPQTTLLDDLLQILVTHQQEEPTVKFPGNIQQMMQQAQKMQQALQQEIEQIKVDASVGGGVVTVQMDGQKNLLDLKISPEAAGDVEMLQDLVLSAVREGIRKVDEEIKQKVGNKVGGLGIPGLF